MSGHVSQLAVRWTARGLSVLATIVLLIFLFGEPFPAARLTLREWIGLAIFPTGVVVGFAIAWWKELIGGALTVGCVVLISLLYVNHFVNALAFFVIALPGVLFILSAWLRWRTLATRTS
jgi:hypothetical protein